VSDFLSRVAARAVASRSVARSRSRFEQLSGPDAGLEIVDEEVVTTVTADSAQVVPRRAAASDVAPAGAADMLPARPSGDAARPAVDAVPAPAPVAPTRESSLTAVEPVEPVHELADAPPPSARPAAAPEAAPLRVALPAVPVTRVGTAAAPARPDRRTRPVAVAAAEEPAVRVHIGRLEVRANLQEGVREQPRPEIPKAEELSLKDYLRGKREAR
jgi:hypothetical protein